MHSRPSLRINLETKAMQAMNLHHSLHILSSLEDEIIQKLSNSPIQQKGQHNNFYRP
jgi:hypothetical protein